MRVTPIIAVALFAAHAAAQQAQPVVIGGVEYQKMESREATEARMMSLLFPDSVAWGEWHVPSGAEISVPNDVLRDTCTLYCLAPGRESHEKTTALEPASVVSPVGAGIERSKSCSDE